MLQLRCETNNIVTEAFSYDVKLITFTPWNWEKTLEKVKPDLLFVESCWFGNKNTWGALITNYTSNGANYVYELIKLTNYCKVHNIPTVFWNKEDPIHYEKFGPTAVMFDYVFTSDVNMIPKYKKDWDINAESLCFFCQPKIHNPNIIIERKNKAAFAGSYYTDKNERSRDFDVIMESLEKTGIEYDIYDRNYYKNQLHFQFPERYRSKIRGSKSPEKMWEVYKGYKYTINVNSVKHSPTMFARRVYESLASGAPVISNYSEGAITQFGGIVCASDKQKDIVGFLNRMKDPAEYIIISEQGVRETLGRHTLADRLNQVCERIGMHLKPHLPIANAIYSAGTKEEVENARAQFYKQGYHRKRLIVNLENSNLLYPYLNQNTAEELFRVQTEFAKPLQGIEVNMRLNCNYSVNYLEDEALKTQF